MTARIYLVRHASPDMTRTDIPYDEPPGPPLTPNGLAEAQMAAEFLHREGVARLYASPFVRAQQTARVVAEHLGLPVAHEGAIGEWHASERARDVVARVEPVLARVGEECVAVGPVCLFSHGGTIGVMLRKLGMPREEVDVFRARYGGNTPSPLAGIWRVSGIGGAALRYELVFEGAGGA